MAAIITLHKRQLVLPDGTVAKFAQVTFSENGTTTQTPVYSDPSCTVDYERSQPVVCDVYGVMPVCYTPAGVAIRITATDQNGVNLPGYPMDDITPEPIDTSSADGVTATPFGSVTGTTVQEQIEQVAALSTDQTSLVARSQTIWTTGGSGNAYTLTPTPAITAYAAGQSFWIRPDRTNTGAVTLDINGLGARNVQKTGAGGTPTALIQGDLAAFREILVADDGVRLMILARRDDVTFGSDINGIWDRLGSGLKVSTGAVTLTFNSASNLSGVWALPGAGFSTTSYHCGGSIVSISASAATFEDLGDVRCPSKTTTSATLRVSRVGAHDFVNGDTISLTTFAIGR